MNQKTIKNNNTSYYQNLDTTKNLNFKLDFLLKAPISIKIAYDLDFYKIFAYLKTLHENSYFFESLAMPRHQDRYYTIGFDPALIFSASEDNLLVETKHKNLLETLLSDCSLDYKVKKNINTENYHTKFSQLNPYKTLQRSIDFNSHDFFASSHQGGLIGYLNYEVVNYFESTIRLKEDEEFKNFKLGLYIDGLIYDCETAEVSYYSYEKDTEKLQNKLDYVKDLVNKSQSYSVPNKLEKMKFIGHNEDQKSFETKVAQTIKKIKEGYSFQTEVGFKSFYQLKGNKIAIYDRLRKKNPSPYMFYLCFGDEELFGASPEILISNSQGNLLTTPTAGTIKRSDNKLEDMRLARLLLNDQKEIAEHNMLVDLHRNDLAMISKVASVKVNDLMYLIKFSHVQHIVSNVIGVLKEGLDSFDVLRAILPGGVVSGAPKIETIKIINENENLPRGPYGGAVGRFSLNSSCDFALPIRSLFCKGDKAFAQTSAGVVFDSQPTKEYEELTNKLAAMKRAIEEAF